MKKIIFVTVGTGAFDELVRAVDEIATGLDSSVVIQIGAGKYEPKNCEFFRFHPGLEEWFGKAWLVLSHGGAGTTYSLLKKGVKMVGVANCDRIDFHQQEILKVLSEKNFLIWCKDLKNLKECVEKAKDFDFAKYEQPNCKIAEKVVEFLEEGF